MIKRSAIMLLFLAFFNIYAEEKDELIWHGNATQAEIGTLPTVGYFVAASQLPEGALVLIENVKTNTTTKAITIKSDSAKESEIAILSDMVATTLGINYGEVHEIKIYLLLAQDSDYAITELQNTNEIETQTIDEAPKEEQDEPLVEEELENENKEPIIEESSEPDDKPKAIFIVEKLDIDENKENSEEDNDKSPEQEVEEQSEEQPEDDPTIVVPETKDDQAPVFEVLPLDEEKPAPQEKKDDSPEEETHEEPPEEITPSEEKEVETVEPDIAVEETIEDEVVEQDEKEAEATEEEKVIEIIDLEHNSKKYDEIETSEFFIPAIDEGVTVTSKTSPQINFLVSINGKELLLPRIPETRASDFLYEVLESKVGEETIEDLFITNLDEIENFKSEENIATAVESLANQTGGEDFELSLEDFPELNKQEIDFSIITSEIAKQVLELPGVEDLPTQKEAEKGAKIESVIIQAETELEVVDIQRDLPAVEEKNIEKEEPEIKSADVEEIKTPETTKPQIKPEAEKAPQGIDFDKYRGKNMFFLQIGIFKDRGSAVEATEMLQSTRFPVSILEVENNGKKVYKVLVGPIFEGEKGIVLKTMKKLGFKDAFFIKL
ncbi:MAG: SPOR domain-containing protein [Spirochaetales bacterium]|nr:SPOR domain-containing protein [Spirochaetales bacterium]